jgi:peptidoglycan/LPS O-acetylase OafA/YrhL
LFQLVIIIPFLLGISIIFYLLVEKPCMHKDWPQRLRKNIQARFAVTSREEA